MSAMAHANPFPRAHEVFLERVGPIGAFARQDFYLDVLFLKEMFFLQQWPLNKAIYYVAKAKLKQPFCG